MWSVGEVDPGAAIAALLGPIIAVAITLWLQSRDRSRERKETLLRQLLATRRNPADPTFSIAVALIPVEFRHHGKVRTAHKDFIAAANRRDSDLDRRNEELILAVMEVLGFRTESARDVVREPYSSEGFWTATRQQQEALLALPRLAGAMERAAAASEESRELLRRSLGGTGDAPDTK